MGHHHQYDETMKVLLRGIVSFARWAIPDGPADHAIKHHRADERVRDMLEEVIHEESLAPAAPQLPKIGLEAVILSALRGVGEPGHPTEMISVSHAQEIVHGIFQDLSE